MFVTVMANCDALAPLSMVVASGRGNYQTYVWFQCGGKEYAEEERMAALEMP
jgi:hypothetical protein